MAIDFKKWIDFYLGGLLLLLLKPLVVILGKTLNRNHEVTPKGRIVFLKLLGGGSLVIALPSILGIKKKYPDIKLEIVGSPATVSFAKSLKVFDRYHVIDDSGIVTLIFSSLKTLAALFRVDTFIDLEVYSRLSTVFSILTAGRNRVGFYLETVFWRRNAHTHLIFFNRYSGVYEFYSEVSRLLDANPVSFQEAHDHFLKNTVVEKRPEVRLISLGPGCSDLSFERRLTAEQWVKALDSELQNPKTVIQIIGGKGDLEISQQVVLEIKKKNSSIKIENRVGETSLDQSISLIASSDHYYGIDSGLLHFARLLMIPSTSFWGPTDPKTLLQPINHYPEEIRYKKVPCSPCTHITEFPPCRGNNVCIQNLFNSENQRDQWVGILK